MQKTINRTDADLEIEKQNWEKKWTNEQYFGTNYLKHTPFFSPFVPITSVLTRKGAKTNIR